MSEVGTPDEKSNTKLSLVRHFGRLGETDQVKGYLTEAVSLSSDPVGASLIRHAAATASTDYLTELEEMIACWERYRSGDLEAFAERLTALGSSLTYRSFSEAKVGFLQDQITHVTDIERRIILRLQIADLFRDLARWQAAEDELDKALQEAEEFADPPTIATVLNNLGLVLDDTNRLYDAEEMYRRALEIAQKSYGMEHFNVATALNNLAIVLRNTNRLHDAEEMYRRALEIAENSFGTGHPNVATTLNNLARVLHDTNRLHDAEEMYRRALEIYEKSFGAGHPTVAVTLTYFGGFLTDANRLEEGQLALGRALEIFRRFLKKSGHHHVRERIAVENYRKLLEKKGYSGVKIDNEIEKVLPKA